jgi:hypothetical protein
VPPGRVVADSVRDDTYVSTPEAEGRARARRSGVGATVLPGSESKAEDSGYGHDERLGRPPAEAH